MTEYEKALAALPAPLRPYAYQDAGDIFCDPPPVSMIWNVETQAWNGLTIPR